MAALDQVRRDEIREKGKEHKDLMKDSRYIWLKTPWNLTPKQRARLSSLEHMNLKINRASGVQLPYGIPIYIAAEVSIIWDFGGFVYGGNMVLDIIILAIIVLSIVFSYRAKFAQ